MSSPVVARTRDVARAAVRADLAKVAMDLFHREGFEGVTVNQVADAAGVSRNTFMRYFDTKEDTVLGALEAKGEQVADALRKRPPGEGVWLALRRALDVIVDDYMANPASALATASLIQGTPSLVARRLEKQCGWRPLLAVALAERDDPDQGPSLRHFARVAAALGSLDVAVDYWAAAGGEPDLGKLLDSAFSAIADTV
ncbi:TetR/AcrR family transcriptional regulator [Rhodococcus erythropolis]|uniref:TetR/AcrR family transcriptional regulator n=1 Tax=Rhodococcus erythropolis TaxID=1833 RepID=UPI0022268585|nr:TetR/AcrR family transcriptional regulator [Rhodococcus erythropolis]MCW2295449.1 AcrR family transcriptional regulator [Rhodococcus erythropolis]